MNRLSHSFRPRLLASYAIAGLVLIVAGVGTVAITDALTARAQLHQTVDLVDALKQVRLTLLDAETGHRGFLLTGRTEYLVPYEESMLRIDSDLARLRGLVEGEASLRPALEGVEQLVKRKRNEMAATLLASVGPKPASAIEIVETGEGRQLMDQIRSQLHEIERIELEQRESDAGRLHHRMVVAREIIVVGCSLAFLFALAVNVSLTRAFAERERSELLLETQAQRLREQTHELSNHEQQLAERLTEQERLSADLEKVALALQKSNQELDQFAYATSHDLKAPLRGITSLASWIEEDLGAAATPKVKEQLTMLQGRARRLEALIEGILAYSRAGRVFTKEGKVDAQALLKDVVELLAPPENVEIQLVGPFPVFQGERVPLQQIFMNLLQNGIKHGCVRGGQIRVYAEEVGDAYRFSISDRGPGIAPEFHERVFGIFQTLATRDQVEGTGIGLAMVKKLVESRGGSVTLSSISGDGATFSFTWPKTSRGRSKEPDVR